MRTLSIGIDIGGTFTDAVLNGPDFTLRAKSPTTREDLGVGVIAACGLLADQAGGRLDGLLPRVTRMTLGTTAVTNALTSRTGRRLGLITTAGFEDEVLMAKGRRLKADGWVVPPPELVARRRIRGVAERVDHNGKVVRPLDLSELMARTDELVKDEAIEALAVSFLWAHANPAHERDAVAVINREWPDLPVMAGALLNPVMREYERTTFALLNAYTSGAFAGIDRLESRLGELGLTVPLLVVNCAGGAITMRAARDLPLSMVHSGPSAGVSASLSCAARHDLPDAVACDMGGTSFDVALINSGRASRSTRGEIFGIMTALPHVDVESIGAGGGSIGWVDSRGVLRVGPQSAGAVPGPACYGHGGTEATITDAVVVLGYIDPHTFLGGKMPLDRTASVDACRRLGDALDLTVEQTAWGIRSIALNNMAKAARMTIARRGLDPRSHSIVSYGGCGSLFTADIAEMLHIGKVVAPGTASVFSAYGAATADTRRERTQAIGRLLPFDAGEASTIANSLAATVLADLKDDGVLESDQTVQLEADMRFRQQVADLTIPLRSTKLTAEVLKELIADFEEEYVRRYGKGALLMNAGVELVALRAIGIGKAPAVESPSSASAGDGAGAAAKPHGQRPIQLERAAGPVTVDAYSLDDVAPGGVVSGPACLDGTDTTIWVPARWRAMKAADGTFTLAPN